MSSAPGHLTGVPHVTLCHHECKTAIRPDPTERLPDQFAATIRTTCSGVTRTSHPTRRDAAPALADPPTLRRPR
jgi:hypothetical protein